MENCSICFGEEKEFLTKLHCGHVFHEECLSNWYATGKTTCAYCRARFNIEEFVEKKKECEKCNKKVFRTYYYLHYETMDFELCRNCYLRAIFRLYVDKVTKRIVCCFGCNSYVHTDDTFPMPVNEEYADMEDEFDDTGDEEFRICRACHEYNTEVAAVGIDNYWNF